MNSFMILYDLFFSQALQLVRAERLWLPHLERRFAVPVGVLEVPECQAMEASEQLGPCLLLYHGCRLQHVEGILEKGFEPFFLGEKAGRCFGSGSYFTDVAAKADGYVDVGPDGCRCLILAEVALGKVFRAFKWMPRGEVEGYDSVLGEDEAHGGLLEHREYVVYKPEQILPRYLLYYRHGEQCECFRCAPERRLDPRFAEASLLTRGAQVQRNEVRKKP